MDCGFVNMVPWWWVWQLISFKLLRWHSVWLPISVYCCATSLHFLFLDLKKVHGKNSLKMFSVSKELKCDKWRDIHAWPMPGLSHLMAKCWLSTLLEFWFPLILALADRATSWRISAGTEPKSFNLQRWESLLGRRQKLATFPTGFPTEFLWKPVENIANGNHMITRHLITGCKVAKNPDRNHVTGHGRGTAAKFWNVQ